MQGQGVTDVLREAPQKDPLAVHQAEKVVRQGGLVAPIRPHLLGQMVKGTGFGPEVVQLKDSLEVTSYEGQW